MTNELRTKLESKRPSCTHWTMPIKDILGLLDEIERLKRVEVNLMKELGR